MKQIAVILCASLAAPALAQELPISSGVLQTGALVTAIGSCPGQLMNAEFATVGLDCIRAISGSQHVTDVAFYTTDANDTPVYRFPAEGWMSPVDLLPQTGALSDAVGMGQGLVVLKLDASNRSQADIAALPLMDRPADPAPAVKVTRGTQPAAAAPSDCDILAQLSADQAALVCSLINGSPKQKPQVVQNRPVVNRGVGAAPSGGGFLQTQTGGFELPAFGAQPASPGARFIRP